MKKSSDVTTIVVAFVQQFWLAIWALVLLISLFVGGHPDQQVLAE